MKARLRMLALAVAILSGCAGIHSKSPEFYILQGQAQMNHGDYESAAKAFTQAIQVRPNPTMYDIYELYPNLMDAYFGRINARWVLQDFAGVIDDLDQVIRIMRLRGEQAPAPYLAQAYTLRGRAKVQTGNPRGAVEDYTQAIYNDAGYVDAYMERGHVNNALGKLDDARVDFAKAISLNPAAVQAFNPSQIAEIMGKATAPANRLSGQRGAEEAAELNQRGEGLYQAGRYAEALPLAQKVLEMREKAFGPIHPDVAASLHNLALLYQAMGDHARAESLFRRSVEINEKIFGAEKKREADTIAR